MKLTSQPSLDSSQVEVTICILNWNGCKLLSDCLTSVERIGTQFRYEIIVIDNGSTDDSVHMVKTRFPQVSLIELEKNISIAEAFNKAILCGSGKYFLLLNNDIVLLENCLDEMVLFLKEHEDAGIVSARLMNPDGTTQVKYYPRRLPTVRSIVADLLWLRRLKGMTAWDSDQLCRMEQVPGASMMVRREVFDQIGLLDEKFTCWYEDVDFCCRCFRSGWGLWYLPQARVIHYGGATFQGLAISQKSIWRFHGLIRYCAKHFSPVQYLGVRLLLFVVLVLRLPLIALFCMWPRAEVRRAWRGVVPAYLGFLLRPSSY